MADKLIITYEEYKKVVEKLALEIEKKYKPTVLVGIMRGAAPIIDILSRTSKLMKAENKSAYLIRPDGYIAARWKNVTPEQIIKEFYKLIFKTEMSHDRK